MKAVFKNGKFINGKAAKVFVKIGIAKEIIEINPKNIQEPKKEYRTERLPDIPKAKPEIKKAETKRGRPSKK
jgi:hypothetical protein